MRKFYWLTLVVLLVVFGFGCAPTITPLPPGLTGEEVVAKEVEPEEKAVAKETTEEVVKKVEPAEEVVAEEKEVVVAKKVESQEPAEFPKSGKYVVDTGDSEFQVLETFPAKNAVKFRVPLLKSQYETEKLNDPDWQLYSNYAWTNGIKWFLVAQDDYGIETTVPDEEGFKDGYLVFPKKGNGWYWVRVWGKDIKSGNWLWINQASVYCRNDAQENPGYEFLIQPETGLYQAAPIAYVGTARK